METRKLTYICALILPLMFFSRLKAEGPLFNHKDAVMNQEFQNVYKDMRRVLSSSSTSKCIDLPTFCVDFNTHRPILTSTSTNDAALQFNIRNTTQWTIGIDNSVANDPLTISRSNSLGTSDIMQLYAGTVYSLQSFIAEVNTSGGDVSNQVINSANAASSDASFVAQVAGTSAGDPNIKFKIGSGSNWIAGTDNSDSDNFKLSQGTALGTSDVFVVTTIGAITQPLQPSFRVANRVGATDVTGDGTVYAMPYATEIYDQGSNFTSNTFTAPVTGRYCLSASVLLNNILVGHAVRYLAIITSNKTYRAYYQFSLAQTYFSIPLTVFADMDVNDTATVSISTDGSTKTVDIYCDSTNEYCTFSGSLIN